MQEFKKALTKPSEIEYRELYNDGVVVGYKTKDAVGNTASLSPKEFADKYDAPAQDKSKPEAKQAKK